MRFCMLVLAVFCFFEAEKALMFRWGAAQTREGLCSIHIYPSKHAVPKSSCAT